MDSTRGDDIDDIDELGNEFNDVIAAIDIGVEDALIVDIPGNFENIGF